jgi:D-amino-acid oxidase
MQGKCFCYDDNPDGMFGQHELTLNLALNFHDIGMSYVFPREDAVWVGGVAERGNRNPEATEEEVAKILDRAIDLCPELMGSSISDVRVAMRPGRSTIRLEPEQRKDCLIVHNYGHGGSGWTVMWGCAIEVVNIIKTSKLSSKL